MTIYYEELFHEKCANHKMLILAYKDIYPKTYIKEWIKGTEGTVGLMELFRTKEDVKCFLLSAGETEDNAEKWAAHINKSSYGHKGFYKRRKNK
jgi:hypothetical protein